MQKRQHALGGRWPGVVVLQVVCRLQPGCESTLGMANDRLLGLREHPPLVESVPRKRQAWTHSTGPFRQAMCVIVLAITRMPCAPAVTRSWRPRAASDATRTGKGVQFALRQRAQYNVVDRATGQHEAPETLTDEHPLTSLEPGPAFDGFGAWTLAPRLARSPAGVLLNDDPRETRKLIRQDATCAPGVYGMVDREGELIYVGQSKSLRNRLVSYFAGSAPSKAQRIIAHTHRLVWETAPDELAALLRELELIRRWRPRFNVRGQPNRVVPPIWSWAGNRPRIFTWPLRRPVPTRQSSVPCGLPVIVVALSRC